MVTTGTPIQRINQFLLFFILFTVVLYFGKALLIPLVFAILLAMLMIPVHRWLSSKGVNRVLSTLICVFILLISLLSILFIVVAQVASFREDLPQIQQKAEQLLNNVQGWIEERFNVAPEEQVKWAKDRIKKLGESAGSYLTTLLGGLASILAGIVLTLVYTFLLLFSKEHYETFFLKLYKEEDTKKVKTILNKIAHVSQQYLSGRVKSMIFLGILYAIGLSIIGIKNALLLSAIAALLTIIPFIGPFIGGLFPVLMALVTEDSSQAALWVIVLLFAIQTIDNYFVEPNVIGGEVNLNAFTTILIVIAGGFIWGVAGMILFIPMLAIAKIVFDHIDKLKPYGYLIGDEKKNSFNVVQWVREKFGIKSKRKS